MNTKKAYLDALNAGRRRRPTTSIQDLNRTLAELENRISGADDHVPQSGLAGFQSVARDIETIHLREDGLEAAGTIALELRTLRDELNEQVSDGLKHEFAALREQIRNARDGAATGCQAGELAQEVERLSGVIRSIGDGALQSEMDEVKATLDQLAREETLRAVGSRWDDFDRRWEEFTTRFGRDAAEGLAPEALRSLNGRLEQIGVAMGAMPDGASMRALDEKLRTLAAAMDRFSRNKGPIGDGAITVIEERLDEISRAIAASAGQGRDVAAEALPFERIEARIGSLAKQFDELIEDRPTQDIARQMDVLGQRIDELSQRSGLPGETVERLSEQLDLLAERMAAPASPIVDEAVIGLETRLTALSEGFETRQNEAFARSRQLFSDLETRLDELSGKIEQDRAATAASGTRMMEAMEERFSAFAAELEARARAYPPADTIHGFEERLDGISQRLETTTANLAAIDPELVRSLEAQVANLSRSIAQPGEVPAQFEDIAPRLAALEQTIADNHKSVLAAAQKAAQDAIGNLASSSGEAATVRGLADDLQSLEALARRSDERNTRTFEAIHDTLLKIVERLGALEYDEPDAQDPADGEIHPQSTRLGIVAPPLETDVATMNLDEDGIESEASGPVAEPRDEDEPRERQRSVLGDITRALRGRRKSQPEATEETETASEAVPELDLDAPLDPKIANQPMEPGTGVPDLNAIIRRVRDKREAEVAPPPAEGDAARSDFIAAARKAAQAAAAEAQMLKDGPDGGKRQRFKLSGLLRTRNKVVMMGIVAVTLALTGLQMTGADRTVEEAASDEPAAPALAAIVEPQDEVEAPAPAEALPVVAAVAPDVAQARPLTVSLETTASTGDSLDAARSEEDATEAKRAGPLQSEPFEHKADLVAVPVEIEPDALRDAAQAGDPLAYFEVGNRYAEGRGLPQDMEEAARWYELAAGQGLAPAQYRLGNLLEKGTGVGLDLEAAKSWYEAAAASGNASAMHNLAVLHAMGTDAEPDNRAAARLFAAAAEMGVRDSQFNMGILTARGIGMTQDLEASYKWFDLVAQGGDKDAADKRDEVAGLLGADALERARQSVRVWKAKSLDIQTNAPEIPDEWTQDTVTTASVDAATAVKHIQDLLNGKGYDAGQSDGVAGERTRRAVAAFQKDNDLEPTGIIDEDLVRALLAIS